MKVPEQNRVKTGQLASDDSFGNNGLFSILLNGQHLNVIASDGEGWEHVSVSKDNVTPTWDEMCFIKDLFWDESDCVVQFHPSKSEYVNNHKHCLHLWKPTGKDIETPPSILTGIK